MINKATRDYIDNLYKDELSSMPTFSDEMIKKIEGEISKIKKDAKKYYDKRNGIKDDNVTDVTNITIVNNISDEMKKEFNRMDKEYNL